MTTDRKCLSVAVLARSAKRRLMDRKIKRDAVATELVDVPLDNAIWRRARTVEGPVNPKYIIL